MKKVVIEGGVVGYHFLPVDFQLDTNKILRQGKITSGFFQTIALLTYLSTANFTIFDEKYFIKIKEK